MNRRHGRPLSDSDIQRFHAYVAVGEADECWLWQGARDQDGYGRLFAQNCAWRANRVAFYVANGYWPQNALHACDNPPCCNPAHLFDGTLHDNILDCKAKGRLNTPSGESHKSRTKPEMLPRGERAANARFTTDQVIEIRSRYLAGGVTHQQLADEYGVKRETISQVLRAKNWKHIPVDKEAIAETRRRNQANPGSNNGNALLTEDAVREMRERRARDKVPYAQLASEYGISIHNVSAIIRRKSWQHVT